MKVIDLLNKWAKGEMIPGKIKYDRKIYHFGNYIKWYITDNLSEELFIDKNKLNDEIEIIEDTPKEDNKIEKIEERIDTGLVGTEILDELKVAGAINKQASYTFDIAKKINEIIDKVNKL